MLANCNPTASLYPTSLHLTLSLRVLLSISIWEYILLLTCEVCQTDSHRYTHTTNGFCLRLVATLKMPALLIRPVERFLPAILLCFARLRLLAESTFCHVHTTATNFLCFSIFRRFSLSGHPLSIYKSPLYIYISVYLTPEIRRNCQNGHRHNRKCMAGGKGVKICLVLELSRLSNAHLMALANCLISNAVPTPPRPQTPANFKRFSDDPDQSST